jgi:aminoglycoside N3'-acetyltransferase
MPAAARPTATIARDLRALGVRRGDALMVHASLRRIGPVEGGADGVIEAIRDSIGPDGTMLMTLGARDDRAWINDRPEEERAALLAGTPPFDAASTPADPDVGALAEVFRRRPGTRVSDHPEGRFGAAGPLAEAWLAEVPWDDYYGPGSPLEALVRAGGRVIRLGPDPATTTLLHYAEYLVPLRHKRRVRRYRLVRQAVGRGSEVRIVECLDDSDGIVPYLPGRDYFADLLEEYLALGRARVGGVGDAPSEIIEAGDLVEFAITWMAAHLGPAAKEAGNPP